MQLPFLDLGGPHSEIQAELEAAFLRVLASSSFIRGSEGAAFEQEFARFCGAGNAVGVGNGLDAIQLLLRAHGVGPGAEVIVPSHTFIATWLGVTQAGATPVPVEPDLRTMNIDPSQVEAAITVKTKAILAVHLYGQPADMTSLRRIAETRGILLLEDAAQAHGAELNGVRTGGLGDGAAFSFYPGKNLGALGDGGAVTTDDVDIAERVRRLGNYGSIQRYVHDEQGFNSRLDEIQAALLRVKLTVLSEWNKRRQAIADVYFSQICSDYITLPYIQPGARSAWHLFVIRVGERAEFQRELQRKGVSTQIHYPISPGRSGAYSREIDPLKISIADQMATEVLSLPIGPHMTVEQATYVASTINEVAHGLFASRVYPRSSS